MINKINRFASNIIKSNEKINLKFSEDHNKFIDALNDDLNTPEALGVFFSFITKMNKKIAENSFNDSDNIKSFIFLKLFNSIFDIIDLDNLKENEIPKEVQDLLVSRQEARDNKDWKLSDNLRDKLSEMGWIVEDSVDGQNLLKKK